MINKFLLILGLFMSFGFSELLTPENNSTLNYIHVLFEWEQEPGADSYQIQVSENSAFLNFIIDVASESLIFIDTENLEWDSQYYWRVRPNNSSDWISTYSFTTGASMSNASVSIVDGNATQDGITVFGAFFDYYSSALDKHGKEVWNSGYEHLVFYHANDYGQWFGASYLGNVQNYLTGVEFSKNNSIIWEEPNEEFEHHEIIQLPNGNYLGIVLMEQLGPISPGPWMPTFQNLGFVADGVTNEFTWVGDKLVEWDKDTGEILWSWNTFDNFSMNDYDPSGGAWQQAISSLKHDWTHANAFYFNESESAIYLSSRHLSRITKIDYPSGNVVWNMGMNMPSGDVEFGHDLGFTFQHSLQVLENGNIVTLDNGNLSQIVSGTDYPTTRAIEIEVIEGEELTASIVWEHSLAEEFFGNASGNAQKLYNGNYLITTIGNGANSFEYSPNYELVWESNYNLSFPSGAIYRAQRIPSLYPIAFSVISPDYYVEDNQNIIDFSAGAQTISFTLLNEGSANEIFEYSISDEMGWLNINSEVESISGVETNLNFNLDVEFSDVLNEIQLIVTPKHHPHLAKTIVLNILSITNCTGTGDVNTDNIINILDIIMIVNHILETSLLNETQLCFADLNTDNIVNILDIIEIINIIVDD